MLVLSYVVYGFSIIPFIKEGAEAFQFIYPRSGNCFPFVNSLMLYRVTIKHTEIAYL